MGKKKGDDDFSLATNRKAFHDYIVSERLEAGIKLSGTEVKSCRQRLIQLREGFVTIDRGEAFLRNVHIAAYNFGNRFNHAELQPRKLLLHKKELRKLQGHLMRRGGTIVPLSFYLKKGLIKVEIGCCQGKHEYDHREDMRKSDANREIKRLIAQHNNRD